MHRGLRLGGCDRVREGAKMARVQYFYLKLILEMFHSVERVTLGREHDAQQ